MEQYLRWKCALAKMFEGLGGVLTLGYWYSSSWSLECARELTRYRSRVTIEDVHNFLHWFDE